MCVCVRKGQDICHRLSELRPLSSLSQRFSLTVEKVFRQIYLLCSSFFALPSSSSSSPGLSTTLVGGHDGRDVLGGQKLKTEKESTFKHEMFFFLTHSGAELSLLPIVHWETCEWSRGCSKLSLKRVLEAVSVSSGYFTHNNPPTLATNSSRLLRNATFCLRSMVGGVLLAVSWLKASASRW